MKDTNILGAIVFALVLLLVQGFLTNRDLKILKNEINRSKRVEILSNGQIHEYIVDNKKVRIVKDSDNERR